MLGLNRKKRSKQERDKLLKELVDCMKNFKAEGTIATGEFNKDARSKNIQELMVEAWLFNVINEINSAENK